MIKLKTGVRTSDLRPRGRRSPARKKKNKGLNFQRFFSKEDISPFDEIEWERRIAEITDDSGKVIFRQEDVEVPKSWSALATKIAVSKYFYGDIANGTDPHAGGRESSIRQLIHRVTGRSRIGGSRMVIFRIKPRRRRSTVISRGSA